MLSTTRQHFFFAETRAKSSCKDLIWISWVSASPFSRCQASWICRSPSQSTLQYSTSTEKAEMSQSVKHLTLASTCLLAIWLSWELHTLHSERDVLTVWPLQSSPANLWHFAEDPSLQHPDQREGPGELLHLLPADFPSTSLQSWATVPA